MRLFDALIVGAGPTGLAAAHGLKSAGARVAVADAGNLDARVRSPQPFMSDLRSGKGQDWQRLLGRGFGRTRSNVSVSPKMRVHVLESELDAWKAQNRILPEGFVATGLLKCGGLSTLWGAMTPLLDSAEIARLGLPELEMADAYSALIGIMGVSGPQDTRFSSLQSPLPLSPNAASLLELHRRKQSDRKSFRIRQPYHAVLTEAKGERDGCNACGGCLWGCGRRSIFDASSAFAELAAKGEIELFRGQIVKRLVRDAQGWGLLCEDGSGEGQVRARSLIVTAGHLPSTRLVLDHLSIFDRSIKMHHAPAFAFAALLPGKIGSALPPTAFGMAQLSFEWDLPGADPGSEPLFGALYDGGSVAPSDLFAGTPLGIGSFAPTAKALMPALVLVFCYLPAAFSNNTVTLQRTPIGSELLVEGHMDDELIRTLRRAASGVSSELAKLGAFALPGSLQLYSPGAEVHAGAELGLAGLIDQRGEVTGAKGLFVADTAALPAITAKHPTLTAMANAYRIATGLIKDGSLSQN